MDDLLTTLEHFLRDFSPTYIYEGAYQIALAYLTTLSGVLLIIAVIIRLSNSSLDSLDGLRSGLKPCATFFDSIILDIETP